MRLLLSLLSILLIAGCTHLQLRNNTVNQMGTMGDIHTQQVMDNLAMFVFDINSLPHFAISDQGLSELNDRGSLSVPLGFGRFGAPPEFGISSLSINPSAERSARGNWVLKPVNDPRRLELMRCAYQAAVSSCCATTASETCPDCERRRNTFYTGLSDGEVTEVSGGIVTSDCIKNRPCWFHVGCRHQVPKNGCLYVGGYCGVYVWVLPEGRDELTKLTLAILDYAVNEPREAFMPLKTVQLFLDADGRPTTEANAVSVVEATVGANESVDVLWKAPLVAELNDFAESIQMTTDELIRNWPNVPLEPQSRKRVLQLFKILGIEPPGHAADFQSAEQAQQMMNRLRRNQLSPILLPQRRPERRELDVLEIENLLQSVR